MECFNVDENDRDWILDIKFRRLDLKVRRDELFLDPDITLAGMARLSGTNRTYVSEAVRTRFVCFRDYLRSLRLERLLNDIRDGKCSERVEGDWDDFARSYGFRTKRSMNAALMGLTGCNYFRLVRRRNGWQSSGRKNLADEFGEKFSLGRITSGIAFASPVALADPGYDPHGPAEAVTADGGKVGTGITVVDSGFGGRILGGYSVAEHYGVDHFHLGEEEKQEAECHLQGILTGGFSEEPGYPESLVSVADSQG